MKIYLLKSIEKVGIAGEIIKVSDGYAKNFIFPQKLGVQVNESNAAFYEKKAKSIDQRKEAIESVTSMLAEQIKALRLTIKRKTHDDNRLYAAISAGDVVDLLAEHNVKVAKSQIIFDKSIKTTGSHLVTVKLSSKLQPQFSLKVSGLSEK
ncbi:MAG TPA: 50S ribosomal protein L9 [Candidatus Saccharimonadales bacterium]|nr:50S ribosomal protein L9 [Candidatus Saccharimonadales bacterium]